MPIDFLDKFNKYKQFSKLDGQPFYPDNVCFTSLSLITAFSGCSICFVNYNFMVDFNYNYDFI